MSSKLRPQLPPSELKALLQRHITTEMAFDGCWEWTGEFDKGGEPICRLFNYPANVRHLVWQDSGVILDSHETLLNACGNPLCVNPRHQRVVLLKTVAKTPPLVKKLPTVRECSQAEKAKRSQREEANPPATRPRAVYPRLVRRRGGDEPRGQSS